MAVVITYWDEVATYPDTVHVEEKPTHSKLLGPDGKPLAYRPNPVGFDLSHRKDK